MSAAEAPCFCSRNPYRRLQGDDPARFPELEVLRETAGHAARIDLRCRDCGTSWAVTVIPGGGIYGDFDWERREPAPGA